MTEGFFSVTPEDVAEMEVTVEAFTEVARRAIKEEASRDFGGCGI